jgi:hypothetical protein
MVLQAMSTEVAIVMGKSTGVAAEAKLRASLLGTLQWLEENAGAAIALLVLLAVHGLSVACMPIESSPGRAAECE